MSHEIETMAYAGEVPWHGLGVPVSNDLTPNQMMTKAGLDWTVEQVDSFIEMDGKKVPTGWKSLVRSTDKKILTNIGQVWNPVQNEDAFNFFSEYVLAGDMEMHTAGSLKGGQMVWALAKVKESFDLFGGDQVEFNADSVKTALGIAGNKLQVYKEMAEFLGSKRFTQDSLIEYYNTVFPRSTDKRVQNLNLSVETLSKNAKSCYDVLNTQPGAKYAEGSWWQAFNSYTFVTDHFQGRNADNRMYSSWFGGNQIKKRNALETAIKFAEVA